MVKSGSATRVWMEDSKVPYAYGMRNSYWEWTAYDDTQSMAEKVSNFPHVLCYPNEL